MLNSSVSHREIWRIAYPIMLGNLAQTIITFTDTAFLGHLGTIELSAAMMAGLYYYVFTTLAMGFAVGIQIFIARRYGEGNYAKIGDVFQHGALFVLALGLLLFGILFAFSNQLLGVIIDSDNIYRASMEYIRFRQFGIIFVVFNFLFRSFYVGLSHTKVITFSTLLMAVVNIFFDWCLIYGKCHLPAMGVGGAAIASLMAEISAFIFFWLYTFVTIPHEKYAMFRWHRWKPSLMKDILKVAFPCMIQRLFSFGAWFAFFILIEKMGELSIGISSVVRSTYMILIIPGFAFSSTANTLTSRLIGEGKSNEVMSMLGQVIKDSLLCSSLIVFITAAIPRLVLQIYTNDVTLTEAAVPTIYIICLATFFLSVAMPFFEAVSGTGNTATAMFLEFGVLLLYVGFIYLMTQTSKIELVWTAELLYNGLMGVISFLYLKKANWLKKRL
ncbi:MAG: MATE family efflux transporter [Bacteroidales bacterium]|nr:MATE family efflux transporter [Bacteroidales bacterium]